MRGFRRGSHRGLVVVGYLVCLQNSYCLLHQCIKQGQEQALENKVTFWEITKINTLRKIAGKARDRAELKQ
jgi:hypothetical protein